MAKKKFVVRDGFTFGIRGEHAQGDVLELDEAAGVAFADKLRPAKAREEDAETANKGQGDEKPTILAYLSDKQRKALSEAGFATQADLDRASDEQLMAVEGVKEVAVKSIRANKAV